MYPYKADGSELQREDTTSINFIILLLSYTSVNIPIYIQWNCCKPRNCDAYIIT